MRRHTHPFRSLSFRYQNSKDVTRGGSFKPCNSGDGCCLMTGKWKRFSLEMLITLTTRAGLHVALKTAA